MHDFPGLKPACSLIRCDSTVVVILFRISRSYRCLSCSTSTSFMPAALLLLSVAIPFLYSSSVLFHCG